MTKLILSPLAVLLVLASMVNLLEATTLKSCSNKTAKRIMQIPPYE